LKCQAESQNPNALYPGPISFSPQGLFYAASCSCRRLQQNLYSTSAGHFLRSLTARGSAMDRPGLDAHASAQRKTLSSIFLRSTFRFGPQSITCYGVLAGSGSASPDVCNLGASASVKIAPCVFPTLTCAPPSRPANLPTSGLSDKRAPEDVLKHKGVNAGARPP